MCGRYSFTIKKEEVVALHPTIEYLDSWMVSMNICPGDEALVLRQEQGLHVVRMRWGMESGIKKLASSTLVINARSETVYQKPTFSEAMTKRRCVVLADSFYEWRKYGKSKLPYRIHPGSGRMLYMAGVWDYLVGGRASFAILTAQANSDVSGIHSRMPVCLWNPRDVVEWLHEETAVDSLHSLMRPSASGTLTSYPVSPLINQNSRKIGAFHEPFQEPPRLF